MGMHRKENFNLVKNILHGSTQEKHNKKFIHAQNHFTEQVFIKLVF